LGSSSFYFLKYTFNGVAVAVCFIAEMHAEFEQAGMQSAGAIMAKTEGRHLQRSGKKSHTFGAKDIRGIIMIANHGSGINQPTQVAPRCRGRQWIIHHH
jgi:hypothetical protein